MNRLGIFFFYDRDGIVDDYIPYLLRNIRVFMTRLIVVVNGKLTDAGRERFSEFAEPSDIIVRENEGLDVWAYRTALMHVGMDHLADYDELIMFNHTIMGPVYPFSEMFDAMEGKDVDFWGITEFFRTEFDPFGTMPDGYIPDHIQSHFIAVRKSLAGSEDFRKYWEEMPMITGYTDSVTRHEARFTGYFEKLGYKWTTYCDQSEYRGLTYNPVITMASSMLQKQRCPIFKRRSFMQDYNTVLNESAGEDAVLLYDFIRDHTDYDTNLIWDNMFRVQHMSDLKKNMHWNYFLPADAVKEPTSAGHLRTALFLHIYFSDTIESCRQYAASMPEDADIFVTTTKQENAERIRTAFTGITKGKLSVEVVPNRGRDVGPFLMSVQDRLDDYDVVCHAHDKKAGQNKPGTIGLSFGYKCFEGILSSRAYVLNVLDVFRKHPRAGLLAPPPPNHGDYYITLGMEWGLNYGNTKQMLDDLGIRVPISPDKEPIAALGSYFWIRTDAMRPLFKKRWSYENFPEEPVADDGTMLHAIERIYPFIAQSAGFYSGWILPERMAAIEVTNLNQMLRELNKIIFFQGGDAGNLNDTRVHLSDSYAVVRRHPYQKKYLRYYRIIKAGPRSCMAALKRHWRRKHGGKQA